MIAKRYIIVLLFVALALPATAQRIGAYVAAGGIVSQIEGDELRGFDKWGFAGGVGAFAKISNNGRWNMAVEAGYARRGSFNNSGDPYNVKIVLDYVDIPLTVFFRDPYGGILVGLGPVYSRLVRQPHDVIAYDPKYFVPDTTNLSFLKNDFALAGEIRFKIWSGLQMSFRYQYSLIPVKKDWQFTEHFNSRADRVWRNNCYNSSFSFRLLWQFGGEEDNFSKKKRR